MAKMERTSCEPYIKIVYAKTDTLIKNFLEAEGPQDVSISKLVQLAIEYYAITGEFIYLGTVSSEEEHPEKLRKTIYFPKGSDALKYINETSAEGKAKKRVICEIIANCIEIGEHTHILDTKEYIVRQNELIKLKLGQKPKITISAKTETKDKPKINQDVVIKAMDAIKQPAEEIIHSKPDPVKEKRKEKKRVSFADSFIKSEF